MLYRRMKCKSVTQHHPSESITLMIPLSLISDRTNHGFVTRQEVEIQISEMFPFIFLLRLSY